MMTIIGVRFRKPGKVYYFSPARFSIKKGDHVIVETIRGVEYGLVVLAPKEVPEDSIVNPLKEVIRVATPDDAEISAENERLEKEAFGICLEKIKKHGLKMKLIDSEYTFDKNKLLFYFTADGRIDFRELVKDLASVFRTRIELRQIGVRDETKMLGGMGICGRPLCCHTFLSDFAPVSIKMAKEQNLSLNPAKISGVCGRLMCCLKNEEDVYEYLNSTLPYIGMTVRTYDGYEGEVQSVNVLKQLVKVLVSNENDEKEVREYPVKELQFDNRKGNFHTSVGTAFPEEELDEKAMLELEQMEQSDLEDAEEKEQNKQSQSFQEKRKYSGSSYRHEKRQKNNHYHGYQYSRYEKPEQLGEHRFEHDKTNPHKTDAYKSGEYKSDSYRSGYSKPNHYKSNEDRVSGEKTEHYKQGGHKSSYHNNSRNMHRNNRNFPKGQ